MTIIAVDQGYHFCALALKSKNKVFKRTLTLDTKKLTSTLTGTFVQELQQLCSEADIALGDMRFIAATVGPSSFTGLRVTLAALQGIAFGNQAKVFACTRLALQAFKAFQNTPEMTHYTSFLSNQRGAFFSQEFSQQNSLVKEISPVSLVSFADYPQKNYDEDTDTASDLIAFAEKISENAWGDYTNLVPFYGHDPVFKRKGD